MSLNDNLSWWLGFLGRRRRLGGKEGGGRKEGNKQERRKGSGEVEGRDGRGEERKKRREKGGSRKVICGERWAGIEVDQVMSCDCSCDVM